MHKPTSLHLSRRVFIHAGAVLAAWVGLRPRRTLAQVNTGRQLRIGVIGAGRIGGTIGGLWVKAGHPVMFSSRHPEQLQQMVSELGPLARAGTVAEAIAFGEALLVAVPYAALPEVGREHADALRGKIVLDACNAVPGRDGEALAQEVERDGIGITSQKYLPGTRLVRAFNTMSYTIFAQEAHRPDPKLAVPIAGDDPEAVGIASQLVREAGFDPVVVGKLAEARRFQRGQPGYGQRVSAAELKQKLALGP